MEVGSVIKRQDNPYDDIVPVLTEILAEIIRNIPDHLHGHVTGFSFISPGPAIPPMVFRLVGDDDRHRLLYEVIESDDFTFITSQLPSGLNNTPHVEIMQDALHVYVDERVAVILIRTPIDVIHSQFTVHRRVLDIALKKIKT
jgi:hypothetical protein